MESYICLYQPIQLYPAQLHVLANYLFSPPTDIFWPAPVKQTIDFDIPNHFRRTSSLTNMLPIVMIRKRWFYTSKICINEFFFPVGYVLPLKSIVTEMIKITGLWFIWGQIDGQSKWSTSQKAYNFMTE